ncbi:MAG: hypothetical protein JW751_23700 [Polyangiaceae bacterium]|nr:hypothetical protein [Polyangiaceae bacterium]
MDRLRLAILSSVLLLWATPAHAGTVAIVRLPSPTPQLTEALSRLHGELLSVGLDVKMIVGPADRGSDRADSRAWVEQIAAEGGIDAVIEIVGDPSPVAVDIWVIEQSPRGIEALRVSVEPSGNNASERLAIRAVEVLRSTFLERDMVARERHAKSIAEPATGPLPSGESDQPDEPNEPAPRPEHLGVEVGATALTSLDGVGVAILPTVRIDLRVRSWFVVQAVFAGLGSHSTVATTAGNARVAHQFGILGGSYRIRPDRPLWPFFALSAGVLHTAVEGRADPPRQGHTTDQWSFLLDGSLGLGLSLPDRYFLTLATQVQLAEPYVGIHFVDEMVATGGRPNLGLALTVGAWL